MRIIRLRNDYKKLMSRVEDELHAYHASMSQSLPNTDQEDSTGNISSPSSSSTFELPFAKVGGVTSGSPAEDSGLRAGDQIRKFGTINWTNHEKLSKVAEIVRANEGVGDLIVGVIKLLLTRFSTAKHNRQGSAATKQRFRVRRIRGLSFTTARLGWSRFVRLSSFPSVDCIYHEM